MAATHAGPDEASVAEKTALVTLLRSRPGNRSYAELTALIRDSSSVQELLDELDPAELFPSPEQVRIRAQAAHDVHEWASHGIEFLTIHDVRYPLALRGIFQAPPFLFARGEIRPDDPAVSVVGSRNASSTGLRMATSVSAVLTDLGVSVVAGLAAGIDAAAHREALRAGGRTVAVIGTGIRRQYPAENRELQESVAENGLLLSQFWPDAPPQKHTFLLRNATMSGYGMATVVIEAGEHSGTRVQARLAVEHGRPVVLTDRVINATDWGKALVGRPGVFVASSVDDVRDAVLEIQATSGRVDQAIDKLLAG